MDLRFGLFSLLLCVRAIETGEMSGEQTFVDIIVSDYFKTEQNLWTMIENRADNVLLQVYKTHESFFNRTITESASGIFMRDFLPTDDPVVQVAVNLNSTAELGYNHLREQELDRKTITDYANYSLKILKDASDLIDLTMQKTFWEKLLNVRAKRNGESANETEIKFASLFPSHPRTSTSVARPERRFKHRISSYTTSIETSSRAC